MLASLERHRGRKIIYGAERHGRSLVRWLGPSPLGERGDRLIRSLTKGTYIILRPPSIPPRWNLGREATAVPHAVK